MPRKVATEPVKSLNIELPMSEYQALEAYCLEHQQTKRQVIRSLLKRLTGSKKPTIRQPQESQAK